MRYKVTVPYPPKEWELEIGDLVELSDGRNVRVTGVRHDERILYYTDDNVEVSKERQCSFDEISQQFIPYDRETMIEGKGD